MDKFLGVMLGGAVGDALGEPIEFLYPGQFQYVTGYCHKDYETEMLQGERTDDTAMALLLADSLLRCNGTDIIDQLDNYAKWHKTGYMGLRPYPEGEGIQTSKMLDQYIARKEGRINEKIREEDKSGRQMDGNGALMRIGPVPLFFYNNAREALEGAEQSCISTHNTIICKHCCMFYTGLIWGALHGVDKKELMKPYYSPIEGFRKEIGGLVPEVAGVANGSYQSLYSNNINPSGYIVNSMEAALWGFYNYDNFRDGMEAVVNLGGDTDTIGCIYGYLGGAYYGGKSIPNERLDGLIACDRIIDFSKQLYKHHQ